jgi:hypothetical protein
VTYYERAMIELNKPHHDAWVTVQVYPKPDGFVQTQRWGPVSTWPRQVHSVSAVSEN